jgi:hypothetical protein
VYGRSGTVQPSRPWWTAQVASEDLGVEVGDHRRGGVAEAVEDLDEPGALGDEHAAVGGELDAGRRSEAGHEELFREAGRLGSGVGLAWRQQPSGQGEQHDECDQGGQVPAIDAGAASRRERLGAEQ